MFFPDPNQILSLQLKKVAAVNPMNVLFMCVANSARSQLAEGLASKVFPNATIMSAGSHPSSLNPHAVTVMQEWAIDISRHTSKSIEDLPRDFLQDLDFVITLCAEEVCPVILSEKATKLHWPFPDPASKNQITNEIALTRFRAARDAISEKLQLWAKELGTTD